MKTRFYLIILFILLAISYSSLQALDPNRSIDQYVHEFWTTDHGLPQNFINGIKQTNDGYLWFATQLGLVRFNGNIFKTFSFWTTEEVDFINALTIYTGKDGALWIGSQFGRLVCLKDGKFITYRATGELEGIRISSICEDNNGDLLIGTEKNGLLMMRNGTFTSIRLSDRFPVKEINHIHRDPKDRIWIATNNGIFKSVKDKFINYSTKNGLPSNEINVVYTDRSNQLWVGTEGSGLSQLKNGKWRHYSMTSGLCDDVVLTIYEDRDKNLWIGTQGGLARFKKGKFESFTIKEGLSNNQVSQLFEDQEGSLWIGTFNGLNRLKDGIAINYSTENGLPADFYWAVYEDSKQNIWLGTNGNGLVRMRGQNIKVFSVTEGLPSNVIRSIFEDSDGSFWIGTREGLARMKNGKIFEYSSKSGFPNIEVRVIHRDKQGTLWVGTSNGLYNSTGSAFTLWDPDGTHKNMRVYSLYEDETGFLLFSTNQGIKKIQNKKLVYTELMEKQFFDFIFFILKDRSGTLWLGTNKGLGAYKDKKWTVLTTREGLLDNTIFRVIEDKSGNFWMSSYQGIFRLKLADFNDYMAGKVEKLNIDIVGKAEGMKSVECNGGSQSSGCLTQNGNIWFPTVKGAVMVIPESRVKKGLPPPMVIEDVIVDEKRIPNRENVEFIPGTQKFEFHYAALTYITPEKVSYKYKLDNFDKDWVDAGNRRTAYYTSVPPGEYEFKVIACSHTGVWNDKGVSFGFYLKPYFYQTYWFYILCMAVLFSIGMGIYRIRIKQLQNRKEELERVVVERTKQLNEANKELERLANQDGLTGIANFRQFTKFLDHEWRRAIRHNRPISLVLIDVDFFKLYNDTYGHQAGDDCLRKIAETIDKSAKRPGDIAARYGGEEFVLVLSETDRGGVTSIAEELRLKVEGLNITHEASTVSQSITISLGCATLIPGRGESFEVLINHADKALYSSKQNGRNRITVSM